MEQHGHAPRSGFTPEYTVWNNIRQRCTNRGAHNFKFYGGRGIRVCDRWRRSFKAFLADVGTRPGPGYSLDRIDNARGYEPGNVAWRSMKEQSRNTRRNRVIEFRGERMCVAAWAERIGMPQIALLKRLRRGWTVEQALTLPLGHRLPRRQASQDP